MKKRVADIVVETLLDCGVTDCFTVVGGGAMHLNNAFGMNKAMAQTFCHHEQACAFAAEGYAKYSGKMAAVSVTSGPGGVNALNGVYSAYVDNAPMIVIAGHPRYDTTIEACGLNLRARGVQEFNIIPALKDMTKYAVMLKDPNMAKYEVQKACFIAMEGRRGPVWISIPLDVQAKMVKEEDLPVFVANEKIKIDMQQIRDVINDLKTAHRPCILTGSGIRTSAAINKFYKFTTKVKVPIVGGALLPDILPEDYPLYYGMSGNVGPRAGNFILQNADYILVLANSLSNRQTGYNVEKFAPNASITMVDISPDEGKKPGLHINKQIICDVGDFFDLIDAELNYEIQSESTWTAYCKKCYDTLKSFDMPSPKKNDRIPLKYFWKVFRELIPNNALIALGNSNCVCGIFQLGVKNKEQRVITNYNAGSMGYDLPEAEGIAKASGKTVYCVTGDGSIMMNLQELETIKYNDFPIKVVIFSNDGYGAIRQTNKNYFNGVYYGCDNESGIDFPNFSDVAKTFGFEYFHCKRVKELEERINEFISYDGRAILEIDQELDDVIYPKIISKLKEDGTFETPSLTDMFPYLDEKIMEELRLKN